MKVDVLLLLPLKTFSFFERVQKVGYDIVSPSYAYKFQFFSSFRCFSQVTKASFFVSLISVRIKLGLMWLISVALSLLSRHLTRFT